MPFRLVVTIFFRFIFLIIVGVGLFSCTAWGQKEDNTFETYRLHQGLSPNDKVLDPSVSFHLARPYNPASLSPFRIIIQLDEGWYILDLPRVKAGKVSMENFSTIVPANNLWKLSTPLRDDYLAGQMNFPRQLLTWTREDLPSTLLTVKKKKIDGFPLYNIPIEHLSDLQHLLDNPNILSIEVSRKRQAIPETFLQRYDPSTNQVNLAHRLFPQWNGRGQTVSIKERAFDTTDIDFRKRWFFSSYTSPIRDGHATEMTTLIGGSGNTGNNGKGVANFATLTSASFDNLLPEPPSYYSNNKITVQNHSYGTGIENEYATDAAAYDLSMWNDSSLLHIFSAGNRGNQTPNSGAYNGINGFNNLTGSFKMSKNSLSVGATDSFYKVEALSSRGPAYDGRIKPELVAFGTDGTSGAAALTSGAALLLQQALQTELGYPPPASLVKVLLIGSAKDEENDGPDFATGYGSLDVYRALRLVRNRQFQPGTAITGQENIFEINIPANTRLLKVTLHWTDTAATPQTLSALINDLDLSVEGHTNTWYPWILSAFPHADSLHLPAKRGMDHKNNTEQVSILNPEAATYRIRVKPYYLATARQRFAITYDIQPANTLFATYPTAKDPVPAGTAIPIRWHQTFESGTSLDISYNYPTNSNWIPIVTGMPAAAGYHYWQPPDTNAVARFRFSAGSRIFESDSFFITGNPQVKPGYVCPDTSLLVWSPMKGAARYQVYVLGDTLMQAIGTTVDTVFKIPAALLQNNYVAISTLSPGSTLLETRAPGFNIQLQGVACYFRSFLTEWDNYQGFLRVSLGTTYEIASLNIQKVTNGAFRNLVTFSPVNTTEFNYTDNNLTPGANTYKVVLILKDGRRIESNIQTIIQPNSSGWWVFPNPVARGGRLQIINRWSDTEDLYLDIFDTHGRKVKSMIVPLIDNSISVANLAAGMYFLVFHDGKNRIGHQKLVILP